MNKSDFEFEWDPCKDRSNRRKHGISFLEASSVFYDDNAILFDDRIIPKGKTDICL